MLFSEALEKIKNNKTLKTISFSQPLLQYDDFLFKGYITIWKQWNQIYFINGAFDKKTLSFLTKSFSNNSFLYIENKTIDEYKLFINEIESIVKKIDLTKFWFTKNEFKNLTLELEDLWFDNSLIVWNNYLREALDNSKDKECIYIKNIIDFENIFRSMDMRKYDNKDLKELSKRRVCLINEKIKKTLEFEYKWVEWWYATSFWVDDRSAYFEFEFLNDKDVYRQSVTDIQNILFNAFKQKDKNILLWDFFEKKIQLADNRFHWDIDKVWPYFLLKIVEILNNNLLDENESLKISISVSNATSVQVTFTKSELFNSIMFDEDKELSTLPLWLLYTDISLFRTIYADDVDSFVEYMKSFFLLTE